LETVIWFIDIFTVQGVIVASDVFIRLRTI